MSKAIKSREARILNNRYSSWYVEFVMSDGEVWGVGPYDAMQPRIGGINDVINWAIDYAKGAIDRSYGRVDVSFKVYGAKYAPMDRFPGDPEYHYIKDELVYTFE